MRRLHARSGCRPGRILSAVFAAVVAVLLLGGQAAASPRVALVIGNAAYASVPTLDNTVNDANDMAATLSDLGFEVLLGIDRTRQQMEEMIAGFAAAARDADVALFFYAGHAFQIADRNYLVPLDFRMAQPGEAIAQTVRLAGVLDIMSAAPGLKIVLLDACRDNPLRLPDADGLARVGSAADFLIAYATQPDAVAFDGEGRNGTFTEALLSHIRTPAQDISEMMISVRKDVMARTGGQQIPWENSSLTRQFRFDAGPPTATPETILYQVAARTVDPALLRLYVERYPGGTHVGEVLALLSGDPGDLMTARRSMSPDQDDGEQLWQLAQRTRLPPLFESYVGSYPEGPHAAAARRTLAELSSEAPPGPARRCELLATHPRDGTETTPGVPFELLARNAVEAMAACEAAMRLDPRQAKYEALLARACAAAGLRERAVTLYSSAADRGDLRAMVSLALLKETGDGVAPDPDGARALYERAAAAGSPDAAINLAVTLLEGAGQQDTADHARGIALMQQASAAGSAIATFNLGVLAQDGQFGVPGDARALFERAAREGEPRGHRAAAVLLDEGRGVPRNPSQAAVQILLGVASDDGSLLRELAEQGQDWSRDTLVSLQQRLAAAGLFEGEADGHSGPALNRALVAWRNGGFDAAVLSG
ncbi:caspase family protein [uncultured Paracoccus sp.]|uniref:caspase family protein n=1 Tax=uncultured Paracoccus sp. TaxID=189685 RepID=UPI002613BD01|nr:caspase family protein [uncultured Paracoccus sp.]